MKALIIENPNNSLNIPGVGKIFLNRESRAIKLNGSYIKASARAYAIVELLLSRRGESVSQKYLCEKIFGKATKPVNNQLLFLIYQLRQKLGPSFIKDDRTKGFFIEAR